jgi:hypothetical protein
MVIEMKQTTAGACARGLLEALKSGSRGRIEQALCRAETVISKASPDAREDEFRDLLEAVVESVGASRRYAVAPAQNVVALQMLMHVAGSGA